MSGSPRTGNLEAERAWCADTLEALCAVDTSGGREDRCLPILEACLKATGADLTHQPVSPGRRTNLLATWGCPRVLLTTHLDCVAPFVPPRREPDALYGRGACDAKGQIVAQLAAISRLSATRTFSDSDFGFAWLGVVGEETDSAGAIAALDLAPHLSDVVAVIAGEPTENRLATAQSGFLHLTLRCRGRRGHGAVGRPGESAIWLLLDWLTSLRRAPAAGHRIFGHERFDVGMISGGEAPNVVAGEATAELVVRTIPDSDFLERCRRLAPEGAEVVVQLDEAPAALSSWPGLAGEPVPFGSDLPRLSALAHGRGFLLGPGSIRDAHRDDEHLRWDDLATGIDRLEHLAGQLLATTPAVAS